jgi:DNA-binding Lrp family transcriptional regulator
LPKVSNQELEGITLKVYLYVVKKNAPVGTREVTRGLNLSSPSVAYRHLEKLEDLGLLQKNEFGEYIVKRKANVHGYTWIGKHLMPKMLLYKVFFLLLILVTVFAMAVFIVEGLRQRRRTKRETETP